jgi:hypothetical protein
LDIERRLERMWKRRFGMIEISEIGSVDRVTGEQGWRKWRQSLSGVFEKRSSGRTITTNKISAIAGSLDDFVRSAFAIRQFSDGAGGSVTVDLDTSHDKIANSEGDGGARSIGAFAMKSATFFGEEAKYLFGELSSRSSKAKKSMNVRSLIGSRGWSRGKAQIERKSKRSANGGDAADDIGAINGAAVPSIGGSVGSFDKNGVGATVIGSNSDGFVEESVEAFDANGFVITTSGNMNIDAENVANGDEKAFKIAAIIDNNKTTEADLQQNFLNK